MQPATSLHHHIHVGHSTRVSRRSRAKKSTAPSVSAAPLTDDDDDEIDQLAEDDDPSGSYHASGEHYRKLEVAGKKSGKGKGKRKEKPPPSLALMSDARAEHILLAARKIGRHRAGMLAGFVGGYPIGQDRARQENERELTAMDGPPTTPGQVPALYTNPGYMFVSPQHPPSMTMPLPPGSRPPPIGYHIVQTPGRRPRAQHVPGSGMENPPTPLDSLLSAARMMNEDGEGGKANGRTRRASAIEEPESPLPKRRKTGGASGSNDDGSRVKSALDVLADQAAAFSAGSKIGGGKGKVKATATTTATGRKPRVRAPPKAKAGVATRATTSRGRNSIDSGSATPRIISPAPRMSTEPSPLDALPSTRLDKGKAKDDVHLPRKDFRPFVPPAGSMSLRPVTRWGDADPGHQESSSPLRGVILPLPVVEGDATAHGEPDAIAAVNGDAEHIGVKVTEVEAVGHDKEDVAAAVAPEEGAGAGGTEVAVEAVVEAEAGPGPEVEVEVEVEAEVDADADADGSADADADAEIDMEGEPVLESQGPAPPPASRTPPPPSPPASPSAPAMGSPMHTDSLPPPLPSSENPPENTTNPSEPPNSLATTSQFLNLAMPITLSRSISEDPGQHDYEEYEYDDNPNPASSFETSPRRARSIPADSSDQIIEPRLGTRAELRMLSEQSVDFGMMNVFDSNASGHENGDHESQELVPGKRARSTYIKWSQEEDDLLAQVIFSLFCSMLLSR